MKTFGNYYMFNDNMLKFIIYKDDTYTIYMSVTCFIRFGILLILILAILAHRSYMK